MEHTRRDRLVTVPVRLYDRTDYSLVQAKFDKAFTTGRRDGLGVELAWRADWENVAMHDGAPVFGASGTGNTRCKRVKTRKNIKK